MSKNVAKWEGERLVYAEEREERGEKIATEEIFEAISPESFTQVLREGEAGKEVPVITMQARRATKKSMPPGNGSETEEVRP